MLNAGLERKKQKLAITEVFLVCLALCAATVGTSSLFHHDFLYF